MKTKDLEPLLATIVDKMPGFEAGRQIIYVRSNNRILKGFYFNRSDLDKSAFAMNAIMLPTYVPWRVQVFLFGKRIGGGSSTTWRLDDYLVADKIAACIKDEGIKHIDQVSSPSDIITLAEISPNRDSPFMKQAVAYSFAVCGENQRAEKALEELISMLDTKVEWQSQILQDSQSLQAALTSSPEAVSMFFDQAEKITKATFGIKNERRSQAPVQ